MSSKGGSPRFFCENCNAEVPKNAKTCPQCGRQFASVRCPACDFTGEETLFRDGCPVCGYSSKTRPGSGELFNGVTLPELKKPAGALPLWVYIFTASVFTAVLAALFFWIF